MKTKMRTKMRWYRTENFFCAVFRGRQSMRTAIFRSILTIAFLVLSTARGFGYDGACPSLPPPTGTVVTVDSELELRDAVNNASPGTTIMIADGTYHLGQKGYYLWINTPDVTLRSASGDRERVVLDDNYAKSEIITIAASNVTVADMTIMRAKTHPIHVVSTDDGDTLNTLIYNVHIIDPGQQAIKINPHAAKVHFTDNGVVACSTLELTDAGRAKVWELNGSCYTGGVDAHQSRGWEIRDNVIEGFWCPDGLSEHGVHFWTGSRDTMVERNLLIDNARGIGFGLMENEFGRTYPDDPCPEAGGNVGHYDGVIRNNFVFASRAELFESRDHADTGIALAQACGARVQHNTVAFTGKPNPFSAIEWRFANTDAIVENNLTTHNLKDRGGYASLSGNLDYQPLSLFVDGPNGDLHLADTAAAAIDQGVPLSSGDCNDDYDGETRPMGAAADIGADEYNPDSPPCCSFLEFGQVELSSTIDKGVEKTIRFQNNYASPVVVAYIMTRNGGQSVDVRVKDVTPDGCVIFMEEPDNEGHLAEQIGYIVMEAGAHALPDGTRIEAGRLTTSSVHRGGQAHDGSTVFFSGNFETSPVVLHTLNTYNNAAFMSSVSPQVNAGDMRLQQEAAESGSPSTEETIGWIAIESGKTGTINGFPYETGRSHDGWNDGVDDNTEHLITYSAGFTQTPLIIVDGYTGNGPNGYWARSSGIHSDIEHGVFAEEDQVVDSERKHLDEGFGFWAIEKPQQ